MQSIELHELRLELGDWGDLGVEFAQLLARRQRLGELFVQPLEFLPRDEHALLGDAKVAMQRQRSLAPLDPLLPAWLFVGQGLLRFAPLGSGRRRSLPGIGQARVRRFALLLQLGLRRQSGFESVDFVAERVPALANALLRDRELFVPQHAGEEGRALRARGIREHGEFFLSSEIRVEELAVRHTQHALQPRRDFLQGVGDHGAVLVQLGVVEATGNAIGMRAKAEFQLDQHLGACLRAQVADRVLVAARRGIAVNRPGDRLEQGGLAGAVGADDACDSIAKRNFGIGVLPEIHEPQPMQLHGDSSRATASKYSTPSFTNDSRFSSASNGRRPRKSRTVSVRVWRRTPVPAVVADPRCESGRRKSN